MIDYVQRGVFQRRDVLPGGIWQIYYGLSMEDACPWKFQFPSLPIDPEEFVGQEIAVIHDESGAVAAVDIGGVLYLRGGSIIV